LRFEHPRTGRRLRLAYCLNLHPAEDLAGVRAGLERITQPLRERLGVDEAFGVGPWLPASVAGELAADRGALDRFAGELADGGLDAFTFNAFPFGGFHREGLKRDVFKPTWLEPERLAFTCHAADVAAACARARGAEDAERHLSISTHAGGHGDHLPETEQRVECATLLARAVSYLAGLEAEGAPRIVLGVEPEPRSAAGDTAEWAELHPEWAERIAAALDRSDAEALVQRHLGLCLDACHAAVEFEDPAEVVGRAVAARAPLAKLQFSNALRLLDPGADPEGAAALLAMDEPVYLHQLAGLSGDGALRLGLDDLSDWEQLSEPERDAWRNAAEWRCHFHVPVNLGGPLPGSGGLSTTRELSDDVLDAVLARRDAWGTPELHVELETYTWSILPDATRGAGALVDGLEREYAHLIGRLERAGWQRA
jgi:sugar phosphate isomerase/epimerase